MDCGDAGHILLSKRVAEDLEQFKHWRPHLYHLGECEVKRGDKVEIANLFTVELGNSERPKRLTAAATVTNLASVPTTRVPLRNLILVVGTCIATAALIAGFLFWQQSKPQTSVAASPIPEKSIAVLPFENVSEDKAIAYFADGIHDEILTKLANIADLKVISRTSTAKYKSKPEDLRTVSQQLGVAKLPEGTVQRAADKIRVNVQLIDARADSHLWAGSFDGDAKDIFAVESRVAQEVADSLQAKLPPAEANKLPTAHRCDRRTRLHVCLARDYQKALEVWSDAATTSAEERRQLAAQVAIRVIAGDSAGAQRAAEEARPLLAQRLRDRPDDMLTKTELSWICLAQKRSADAMKLAQQSAARERFVSR